MGLVDSITSGVVAGVVEEMWRSVRSVLIGATRCEDKCENTVLLETQGPCGIVRRCSDDTVTHDTSVQVKMSQETCTLSFFSGRRSVYRRMTQHW